MTDKKLFTCSAGSPVSSSVGSSRVVEVQCLVVQAVVGVLCPVKQTAQIKAMCAVSFGV